MAARSGTGAAEAPEPAQESRHIEQVSSTQWRLREGFVDNMRVPGYFYVNEHLRGLVDEELKAYCARGEVGGFLPAVKQIANVAALPGIVKAGVRGGIAQVGAHGSC